MDYLLRRTESQSVMKYLNQAMTLQSCPGQCAGIHFSIHNDITGFDRVNVQGYISVYTMTLRGLTGSMCKNTFQYTQ